jgi:hypothetical protein
LLALFWVFWIVGEASLSLQITNILCRAVLEFDRCPSLAIMPNVKPIIRQQLCFPHRALLCSHFSCRSSSDKKAYSDQHQDEPEKLGTTSGAGGARGGELKGGGGWGGVAVFGGAAARYPVSHQRHDMRNAQCSKETALLVAFSYVLSSGLLLKPRPELHSGLSNSKSGRGEGRASQGPALGSSLFLICILMTRRPWSLVCPAL